MVELSKRVRKPDAWQDLQELLPALDELRLGVAGLSAYVSGQERLHEVVRLSDSVLTAISDCAVTCWRLPSSLEAATKGQAERITWDRKAQSLKSVWEVPKWGEEIHEVIRTGRRCIISISWGRSVGDGEMPTQV